jgi:hypothetical protein
MTVTIDSAFIAQYSGLIHNLVEQQMSKLRPTVSVENAKGEKHFFDRLGSFTAEEVVDSGAPMVNQDAAHSRRMATIRDYKSSTTLSDQDKLKMLIDPASDYLRKLAAAHARKLDEVIAAALVGTAATGKTGTGSASFDANNIIAHGSAGMSVAKFNQAIRLLEAADVDTDTVRLFCVMRPDAYEDLLNDSTNKFTSFDYKNDKPQDMRTSKTFRDVNLIKSNKLPDSTAGSVYRALMYTEDAVKLAIADELRLKVNERPDLSGVPMQFASYMSFGAVRMEEALVIDILHQ